MDPAPALQVPRTLYGIVMLVTSACAGVAGVFVAHGLASGDGGNGRAFTSLLLLAFAIGSLATAVPIAMRVAKEHWGVVVLGSGAARSLLVLLVCFLMQPAEASARPLFMGALAFVFPLLVVETALTVWILSRLDQQASILRSGVPAGSLSRNPA